MTNGPVDNEREFRRLQGLAKLAAVVAHKMNNDLTEVTCNIGLILEDLEEGAPPEDIKELLGDALRAAEHAAELSQGALALFRLDATDATPMPLQAYFKHAAPRTAKGAIEWTLLEEDPLVIAGPARLDRILEPVLTNAVEAAPHGAVEITTRLHALAKALHLPDTVDSLLAGTYVATTVRDRGPGIEFSRSLEIFEPFVTNKGQGRGLALATALNVARAHGGTMGARNHPDGGAEITIWLPIAGEP